LPRGRRNLACRAAEELLRRTGRKCGLEIRIRKNIPVAAGLGGGSSDAAAVLIGTNRLCRLGLRRRALMDIAKELGADVPFFVSGYRRAVGTGRGDELRPVRTGRKLYYVLVNPRFGVSTAAVYRRYRNSGRSFKPRIRRLLNALSQAQPARVEAALHNDLQKTVLNRHRRLKKIIDRLKKIGVKNPLITGSGPTVFALAKNAKEAKTIRRKLAVFLPGLDIRTVTSYNR
jgi:4-diphosphocytidyl-2-C-methyl-D-erythritol kinase